MKDPPFYLLKRIGAFTLIELLIVVAIIAILAAIAVPNFLEAQTRSKVARTRSDMRTMGMAIESYRLDNNAIPYPGPPFGYNPKNFGYTHAWLYVEWDTPAYGASFNTWAVLPLTTPIAYASGFPADPFSTLYSQKFSRQQWGHNIRTQSYYYCFRWNKAPSNVRLVWQFGGNRGDLYRDVGYYLASTGPDIWMNFFFSDGPADGQNFTGAMQPRITYNAVPYDATNGSTSEGELVYIGSGVGFGKR